MPLRSSSQIIKRRELVQSYRQRETGTQNLDMRLVDDRTMSMTEINNKSDHVTLSPLRESRVLFNRKQNGYPKEALN